MTSTGSSQWRTNNGALSTFKVDGKNQLTNGPVALSTNGYDGNGNLISARAGLTNFTYCYDVENRLVRWVYGSGGLRGCDDAPGHDDDLRTDFCYDGQGGG